ncbi:hypothetical protein K439DRAFT_1061726 [Ramaria rubella]|nr:hypothetical protein K439DRAFT_1061726 [Ramaria rubella]
MQLSMLTQSTLDDKQFVTGVAEPQRKSLGTAMIVSGSGNSSGRYDHNNSQITPASKHESAQPSLDGEQADLYEPPPDGGATAWLVVLSCFLFNFNILGITYTYGRLVH